VEQVFRRRQAKTHGRLMRDEFTESFAHMRSAVGHAAESAADLIGPRMGAARRRVKPGLRRANIVTAAAVVPIARAARTGARSGARQAELAARAARKGALVGKTKLMRKEPRVRRWPMMLSGLLVAGAAVGAAGALVARRRANRSQWEEYGAPRTGVSGRIDSMTESARSGIRSAGESATSGKEKVQSLAESAKERAADLMGTTRPSPSPSSTPGSTISSGPSASDTAAFGSREDLYGKAGSGSSNSR
jgi:hypothetical protein